MKKLHVALLFALLVVSSLLVFSIFEKRAEAGKGHQMTCESVGKMTYPVHRCENPEVFCYLTNNGAISCFKK